MIRTLLLALSMASLSLAADPSARLQTKDQKIIQNADRFSFGPVGFAGTTAEAENAFWRLHFNAPNKTWIEVLLNSKNPVAQAYAATSIYLTDPAKLQPVTKARKDLQVPSMSGCIAGAFAFDHLEEYLTKCGLKDRAKEAAKRSLQDDV